MRLDPTRGARDHNVTSKTKQNTTEQNKLPALGTLYMGSQAVLGANGEQKSSQRDWFIF